MRALLRAELHLDLERAGCRLDRHESYGDIGVAPPRVEV
jgi:hypothetical protein